MKPSSSSMGFWFAFLLPLSSPWLSLAQDPFGPALDEYTKGEKAESRKEGGIPNYNQLKRIAGENPDNPGLDVFTQMMGENSKRKKASKVRGEGLKHQKAECDKLNRISAKYGSDIAQARDCSGYDAQEDSQSATENMQDNINQGVMYGALAIGIVQAFKHKAAESPQQKAVREAQLQKLQGSMDKAQAANQRLQASTESLKKRMAALKALEAPLDEIDKTLKKLGRPDPKSRQRRSGAMVGFNTNSPPVQINDKNWNKGRKLTLADVPPPAMSGDSVKEARAAAGDKKQEVQKELEPKVEGVYIAALKGDVRIVSAKETAARMVQDASRNPFERAKSGGDLLRGRPLRAGDKMRPGDTILTGQDGLASVHLPGGTEVRINANSTFKMMEGAPATSKKMSAIYLNKKAELTVHTNNAVATSRG